MLLHGRDNFVRTMYWKIHGKRALYKIVCRFVCLVCCFEFSCRISSRLPLSIEFLFPLSETLENTFSVTQSFAIFFRTGIGTECILHGPE